MGYWALACKSGLKDLNFNSIYLHSHGAAAGDHLAVEKSTEISSAPPVFDS